MAKRKKVETLEEMMNSLLALIEGEVENSIAQDSGNNAAGKRLRKSLQEVKVKAQLIRVASLERRK